MTNFCSTKYNFLSDALKETEMDSFTVNVETSNFSLGISIPNPSCRPKCPSTIHASNGQNKRSSQFNAGFWQKGNFVEENNSLQKLVQEKKITETTTQNNGTYDQSPESEPSGCDAQRNTGNNRNHSKLKSSHRTQMSSTLKWLIDNYERAEGVCLPRCVLYTHYLDFCKRTDFTPAGAATFGKIIRQRFPKLTTRRLGTRGQSKYHYYGIGIKESSIYYHSVYTGKGLTRFSGTKVKTESSHRKYSLSSKTGTLLPDFPQGTDLVLPEHLERKRVETFLVMYRTHCQRILDTVISANFDEVQSFFLHFWQGMPSHLLSLLNEDLVAELIAFCDSILYKVLTDVLVPNTIQDLPESLNAEVRSFIKRLPMWLENSLEDLPAKILAKKLQEAKIFVQSVQRQISFVQLAQASRVVLMNQETVSQILEDLEHLDFHRIVAQASFADLNLTQSRFQTIQRYFTEFQDLLSNQTHIECLTEWLDSIADLHVLQKCHPEMGDFQKRASSFLLMWSFLGSLIMKEFTLHKAASFGATHLVRMMMDEYVFLVMETHHQKLKQQIQQKTMNKYVLTNVTMDVNTNNSTIYQVQIPRRLHTPSMESPRFASKIPNTVNYTQILYGEKSVHARRDTSTEGISKETKQTDSQIPTIRRVPTTVAPVQNKSNSFYQQKVMEIDKRPGPKLHGNTNPYPHTCEKYLTHSQNRDDCAVGRRLDNERIHSEYCIPNHTMNWPNNRNFNAASGWNYAPNQQNSFPSYRQQNCFPSYQSYPTYNSIYRQTAFHQPEPYFYCPAPQLHVSCVRNKYADPESNNNQYSPYYNQTMKSGNCG